MTKKICDYCGKECEKLVDRERPKDEKNYIRVGITRIGSGVNSREYDFHEDCAKEFYKYLDKFKKK